MTMVPDAGTRGHTVPPTVTPYDPLADAPPQGQAQPTAQDPALHQKLAIALGILAGDDYGVPKDTPPPKEAMHLFGPQDQADALANATAHDANVKYPTAAPDHGGTIYSGSFAHDLLASLNMPVTFENIRAINAWAKAEGTKAAFNPLATTQKYGSYTQFNSVGVKNYADYHNGVMATANVLVNGKYQGILDALAKGTDAVAVARAVAASPWGTGNGVLRVLGAA